LFEVSGMRNNNKYICKKGIRASLTVEAALVMPIFLYFMLAFLYFLQVFSLQEQLQAAMTKMGLNLAKTAYIYSDFIDSEDAQAFDQTIFGKELDINLQEITSAAMNGSLLKLYAGKYIDMDKINHSCIKDGFEGISFFYSRILNEEECIDIIAKYRISIPIRLFIIDDMQIIQRVRLRGWTGYEVSAKYSMEEVETQDKTVYITETGSVYHYDKNCSHIKLSVQSVFGLPSELRNNYGGKYYPCEVCITGTENEYGAYFITSDGTRYHSRRDCSGIKRNVKEIKLSEIDGKKPCKRCGSKE
jgi:hypothetical protein